MAKKTVLTPKIAQKIRRLVSRLEKRGYKINQAFVFGSYVTGRKKSYSEAQDYYTQAKSLMEKIDKTITEEYAFILYNLASVCWGQRKNSLAGKYFRQAYELFERIGYDGPYKIKALQNAQKLGH